MSMEELVVSQLSFQGLSSVGSFTHDLSLCEDQDVNGLLKEYCKSNITWTSCLVGPHIPGTDVEPFHVGCGGR